MKIMAIDYGDVRVGLAISDPLRITANGLDNLVINGSEKKFISGIRKLLSEYEIDEIVIGYPKNMDGSISKKAEVIDSLIPKLELLHPCIKKIDERLTTVAAHKTMNFLNVNKHKKRGMVDTISAVYILEIYVNKLKNG